MQKSIKRFFFFLNVWNVVGIQRASTKESTSSSSLFCFHQSSDLFLLLHRRWAHLAKTEKETTSMSGWFSVGDPYGSGRRPSASVTGPLMHCCLWRGSSMDDRSTVRQKFMLCQAPASTVCGKLWRVSSWSPVRAQEAVETTVTHTQSSKLHFSFSASVFFYFPLYLFLSLITSVPAVPFLHQNILWKQK